MQQLRYGVIGTSPIATQYITSAQSTGLWNLCAMYSRTKETGEAFAAKHGVDVVYTDLEEFAKSDLFDAVYISSPNALHYQQCKVMLEHGKHVICEKPFTSYPWQMKELYEIAAQKNLIIMEAIMLMHQPTKKALQDAIVSLGDISMALFENSSHSPQYDRVLAGEYPNVFDPALHGGTLMDMGIYCVYPALALFGAPSSFSVKAKKLAMDTDAYGVIVLEYPDKIITLRYSKVNASQTGSEILGAGGRISIDSIMNMSGMTLHLPDGSKKTICGTYTKTELMANEARDFASYILQRGDAAVQAEYELCKETSMLVCDYMEQFRKESGLAF